MRNPKRLLIYAGVLAGLLAIATVALPFLIDANNYHSLLETQLQQRLHRPVKLGNMRLTVFPLAIRINDVIAGQPEGYVSQQPFLAAQEVYVSVALVPLLQREIRVKAIQLKRPTIELIRNPAGAWNYETGTGMASSDSSSNAFAVDELRIEDGQLALTDLKSASPRDVYQHTNLKVEGLGSNRRGTLAGTVRLDRMAALLSLNSEFQNAETFAAKGTLTLKSDNNKDPLEVTYDIRGLGPVAINALTAKLGSLAFNASGSIDTHKTPPALQLSVKAADAPIADLIRVIALYSGRVPADLKADGFLRVDLQVTGNTEKPLLTGKIQATKAQITSKELAEPVRSSELTVDLMSDQFVTQPFTIETGSTRLTAQATVVNYSGTSPKISATIQTNGARVEELLRIASAYGVKPAGLAGTGMISLDMKISAQNKNFDYSGSGSVRNFSLSSPDLPKTLNVPAADVKFSDDRLILDHVQAELGSMRADGSASIRDFARPNVQFNAHVNQLNSAELRQWGGGTKQPSRADSGSLKKITANGTVAVDKIQYEQITLSNVKATVNLANGILKLDPLSAQLFGGQANGSISANLAAPVPAYTVTAKLANVDSNQLLSATTSVKNVLSGPLSSNADLQFVSKPNEDMAKSLNGKLQLQMGQGRIAGIQILNEVANVGRFFGYTKKTEPFTDIVKLTGNLNIQDGVASTNDLLLDLGGGTLTGAGTVGLVDQSLKLRVTTVLGKDLAQRNVPGQIGGLLSTVLSNQQGELVVPMIVSGTFANPKFAPDAAQVANLKLRGLLPTANNPSELTSRVKGIVDAFSGKQGNTTTNGDSKSGDSKSNDNVQGIINLFDQFRKKKPETKQ